ncbi:MAG: DMT family transporter [Chitinophagaceae bacterium]|nr:DMT family transporter [Chitinophagaceae bacterium]
MSTKLKAHLGILAANIFFAINISAVKHLTQNNFIKPFAINILRVGVSALLFWMLLLFASSKKISIKTKHLGQFSLCALCGIALNQTFFIKGLSLTLPVHAALLLLITPILISLAAVFILKESFTTYKLLGLMLGIAGAVILITAKEASGSSTNMLLGDLFIILNAIVYAGYFILVKPLMLVYNPIHVIRWIFTIGFFMLFPLGYNELIQINFASFTSIEWLLISLVVITGTFFAYLFNIYGIKKLGASVTGAYIYTQPVFAALIANIFLGEKLNAYKILAAVLIFTSVFLVNKTFSKNA